MAVKTNVNINGKNYYRIRKVIGKKLDGSPVIKSFYGKTKTEAEEKANKYINDVSNGLNCNIEYYSIEKLMHIWLFDFLLNSSKIKPSTFERYETVYRNYIKTSPFAGTKISDINPIQIQKYYNELSEYKTSSQISTLNQVLKTFFNWCNDNSYLLKNPCLKLNIKANKSTIINNKRKAVEILSSKEINTIKNYIKGTNFELIFLLDLATGLRRGELLALDWKNINLKRKEIKVEQSVKEVYIYESSQKRHRETIIQTPKTENSFRIIPIPNSLISRLELLENKKGLLFLDEFGQILKGKNISARWAYILKKCNIPHKKFHAIRHTYASLLLQKGVDIQTVAELMGHTAISITQLYTHSTKQIKTKHVNKLNSILN